MNSLGKKLQNFCSKLELLAKKTPSIDGINYALYRLHFEDGPSNQFYFDGIDSVESSLVNLDSGCRVYTKKAYVHGDDLFNISRATISPSFEFFKYIFIDSITDKIYYRSFCQFEKLTEGYSLSIGSLNHLYVNNEKDVLYELEVAEKYDTLVVDTNGKARVKSSFLSTIS